MTKNIDINNPDDNIHVLIQMIQESLSKKDLSKAKQYEKKLVNLMAKIKRMQDAILKEIDGYEQQIPQDIKNSSKELMHYLRYIEYHESQFQTNTNYDDEIIESILKHAQISSSHEHMDPKDLIKTIQTLLNEKKHKEALLTCLGLRLAMVPSIEAIKTEQKSVDRILAQIKKLEYELYPPREFSINITPALYTWWNQYIVEPLSDALEHLIDDPFDFDQFNPPSEPICASGKGLPKTSSTSFDGVDDEQSADLNPKINLDLSVSMPVVTEILDELIDNIVKSKNEQHIQEECDLVLQNLINKIEEIPINPIYEAPNLQEKENTLKNPEKLTKVLTALQQSVDGLTSWISWIDGSSKKTELLKIKQEINDLMKENEVKKSEPKFNTLLKEKLTRFATVANQHRFQVPGKTGFFATTKNTRSYNALMAALKGIDIDINVTPSSRLGPKK